MREPREHLKTLQRRVDFLKSRDHKNSFDHAELGSLEWALVNLQTERTWVNLTHDEYDAICDKHSTMSDFNFLADIETKLMEKNQ